MLTCYSPVRHSLFISIATEWSAFDLHVLGTPPAFVLSQDQTLHRDSRPAKPPQKRRFNQPRIRESPCSDSIHGNNRPRNLLQDSKARLLLYLTVNPSLFRRTGTERIARTGFWLSLFRFQGATGHTPIKPELVPGVPKDCSRRTANCWRVSFGRRQTEGPIRRACHLIRCAREGQRVQARKYPPEAPPRADRSPPMVPVSSARPADPPCTEQGGISARPADPPPTPDHPADTPGGVR